MKPFENRDLKIGVLDGFPISEKNSKLGSIKATYLYRPYIRSLLCNYCGLALRCGVTRCDF